MKLKVFIGIITIFLVLGCPSDSSSTPELLVTAEVSPSSVSGYDVTVVVSSESAAVTGASIVISGTTITESGTAGTYTGNLATATTGDTLSLSVTKDGYSASSSNTIPEVVTVTSPGVTGTEINSYNVATAVAFIWNELTGSDAVDEIELFIDKSSTAGQTTDYSAILLGSATTHTVPANTVETPDVTTFIYIKTKRKVSFNGENINTDSEFEVSNSLKLHVNYNPG